MFLDRHEDVLLVNLMDGGDKVARFYLHTVPIDNVQPVISKCHTVQLKNTGRVSSPVRLRNTLPELACNCGTL